LTQALPFAESLLCWQLACYGIGADIAPPSVQSNATLAAVLPAQSWQAFFRSRIGSRNRWIGTGLLGIFWALVLIFAVGWNGRGLALAGTLLIGSLVVPAIRRLWIARRFLAEFETVTLVASAFCLWKLGGGASSAPMSLLWIEGWNAGRQTACCIFAALFIFAVRGGSLVVLGILEKAGGVPIQALAPADGTYNHAPGELIGYIERAIVLTFVAAGNLQALAFFFVAKGLARSKKLDDDTAWANYFVLGSLASFFLALVCGLIGQQTLALFWK